MKARNPYVHKFKLEAVKLVTDQGVTPHKIASDLAESETGWISDAVAGLVGLRELRTLPAF